MVWPNASGSQATPDVVGISEAGRWEALAPVLPIPYHAGDFLLSSLRRRGYAHA